MAARKRAGPSSPAALYRALEQLNAAPTLDPARRAARLPPSDAPLLLGAMLAKAELDAAVRADPAEEPPTGLTNLLTGYRSLTATGATGPAEEDLLLRLLTLRLIRTATEITTYADRDPDLLDAAADATMAAANLLSAHRFTSTHTPNPAQAERALTSAAQFTHRAHEYLNTPPRSP